MSFDWSTLWSACDVCKQRQRMKVWIILNERYISWHQPVVCQRWYWLTYITQNPLPGDWKIPCWLKHARVVSHNCVWQLSLRLVSACIVDMETDWKWLLLIYIGILVLDWICILLPNIVITIFQFYIFKYLNFVPDVTVGSVLIESETCLFRTMNKPESCINW